MPSDACEGGVIAFEQGARVAEELSGESPRLNLIEEGLEFMWDDDVVIAPPGIASNLAGGLVGWRMQRGALEVRDGESDDGLGVGEECLGV